MKVLIASNSIGLWRGGHARNIMYLASALRDRGVDVRILTSFVLDNDVLQMQVPITRSEITPYSIPKFARALTDYLSSEKYDILHSNGPLAYHYLVQSKGKHIPTFFHARSSNLSNSLASVLDCYILRKPSILKAVPSALYEFWFDLIVMKKCNRVFANCRDTLNRLNKIVPIRHKTDILHNGTDILDSWDSCRDPVTFPDRKLSDPLTVGYLANHNLLKGWKYLVDIISKSVVKSSSIRFLLAGDGPLFSEIEQDLAWHTEAGRVTSLGRISDSSDKENFFNSLDLFICPAHAPTTVLEALAHKIPVVWLSRWQDCADGIDTDKFIEMGWITRFRNISAQVASEFLTTYKPRFLDPNVLCTHLQEEYSWNKVADRALTAYSKELDQRK